MRSLLQRIPGTYAIFFISFLFWGPLYTPSIFSFFYIALHLVFINNNFRTAWGIYSISKDAAKEYSRKYSSTVQHLIILPNYKESMETLTETLDILASHEQASVNYTLVLAMEASESQAVVKAKTLVRMYQDHFSDITFTIHPAGLEGEVRGKSSNVSWAVSEMDKRKDLGENCVLTIMDSDTCFAQDYFIKVSDAYFDTRKEDRGILMFAPPTIFDRYVTQRLNLVRKAGPGLKFPNSANVPAPIRIADMLWSGGVMSHLFEGSPIKFPCSAYSLSLKLAKSVGFWDSGTDSIGEDMHMYLKCFFSTQGQLIVKTILSPASQCNVEGSSYLDSIGARYSQSKRHMWGCLDVAYVIRRTIFGILKPGYDITESGEVVEIPMAPVIKPNNQFLSLPLSKVLVLFLRVLEAHIIMGHIFALVFVTGLYIPQLGANEYSYLWTLWSSSDPHPILQTALDLGLWLRFLTLPPLLLMLVFYEKYHQWGSSDRWEYNNRSNLSKVQYLGKRPTLVSTRTNWNLTDWFYIPVSGLLFLTFPQLHAHMLQLWTDKLDYKVASKPPLEMRPVSQIELVPLVGIMTESNSDNEDGVNRSNKFFLDDANSSVSHGDSGFFEFEADGTVNTSSPAGKRSSPFRNYKSKGSVDLVEDKTSWTVSV